MCIPSTFALLGVPDDSYMHGQKRTVFIQAGLIPLEDMASSSRCTLFMTMHFLKCLFSVVLLGPIMFTSNENKPVYFVLKMLYLFGERGRRGNRGKYAARINPGVWCYLVDTALALPPSLFLSI